MLPNSLYTITGSPSLSPLPTVSCYAASSPSPSSSSVCFFKSPFHCNRLSSFTVFGDTHFRVKLKAKKQGEWKVNCSVSQTPLKVMISGPPSSGKGTQCDLIAQKFGLVHISTGDILRAELSAGTEIGNKAKEFMNSGRLVPDEIVTAIVVSRLSKEDVKQRGWLLDGYPRTFSQAESLGKLQIRPDICIVLDVPDEVLIYRVVARRQDPVTKKIYNLNYDPPETEEIKARLITRPDDNEEKVKLRLQIYKRNAEAMMSTYSSIINKIDGNRPKAEVFNDIESLLSKVPQHKAERISSGKLVHGSTSHSKQSIRTTDKWRGIPTRLNNVPHSKEIREYFYEDVLQATQRAIKNGKTRLKVEINIPELNPQMDVYRIGTLMELVRSIALSFADDGKRVKVCVQGSMGEGALAGMPLQLAGTRQILEFMDWGDDGALGTFIKIGSIGSSQVDEQDDMFILVAPQNAVGNCIIDDLKAMTDAAGERPVILINPRLKDLPSSSGIMQAMGREERLKYAASFSSCYFFRLHYYAGTQYPIMGATRFAYPNPYEIYKRVDEENGKEKYVMLSTFAERPTIDEINNAFLGKPSKEVKQALGIWGFLSGIL